MKLGDCEVWIACDDEPLTEYAVTQEGSAGKQIACFVPSEAGKVGMLGLFQRMTCYIADLESQKFAIHFRNHSSADILRFSKRLDGLLSSYMWLHPGKTKHMWGTRVSATARRPYEFSELRTTGKLRYCLV